MTMSVNDLRPPINVSEPSACDAAIEIWLIFTDDEGDCIVLLLDILLFYDQVTVQGKRDIPPDSLLEQVQT
jgi:hypothetical protein